MGSITKIKTDCLIIGGGLAGWMAAREAVHAGINTLLVHDGMGVSPWVHGFNAPVHPEDSPECFLKDTLESGQGLSDPALASVLCSDALGCLEELQNMGLSFNREGGSYQMLRPLGASYPRVVSIGNKTGVAVLKQLHAELDGRVSEIKKARALRLLVENNCVTGALVYDYKSNVWLTISAHAIVLACGGFCGIYPVSTYKSDSGGDGIGMAFEAGAELCDMEFILFEPSAAIWPEELIGTSMITTMFFEGAVLRNRNGKRFMLKYGEEGECVSKDVMARRIAEEIIAGKGTEHGGVYFDASGVGRDRLNNRYAMYVKRYRAVGIDLATEWVELAPAPHTSLGGVKIDKNCCTTLSGLFACGEVIGGLHGANRIGGSAGLETLVFGKRAGQSAAAYVKLAAPWFSETVIYTLKKSCVSITERLTCLHEQMQQALRNGVNVIREENLTKAAVEVFENGLKELKNLRGINSHEEFLRLRLTNDMTAALLSGMAALTRRDTLGCHTRSDTPERAKKLYRLVLKNDGDGKVEVRKEFYIR